MAAEFPKPDRVDAMTKAIGKLTAAADSAKALDQARVAMGMMTVAADKAAKANDRLVASQKKSTAAKAARDQNQLAAAQKSAAKAQAKQADDIAKANKEFDASAMSISGALDALKATGPEGYAVAIALQVATAGALALTAALVGLAAAAISVVQQRAGLLATFSALSWGAKGGKETLAVVDGMAKKLPFARQQVEGWAKDFQKVNLQGKDLEKAIQAVAHATAIMGDEGGAAVKGLIEDLARGGPAAASMVMKLKSGLPEGRELLAQMGLRIEDLAAAAGVSVMQFKRMRMSAREMAETVEKALAKKGAGPLAELALTFPAMIAKLKEGFFSLFEKLGPAVKPFMAAIKNLFAQFGRGTGTMGFFQSIVTKVFTVLFAYATKAINFLQGGFAKIVPAIMAIGKFLAPVVAILISGFKTAAGVFLVAGVFLKPIAVILKKIFSNALVLQGIQTILKGIALAAVVVIVVFAAIAGVIATVIGVIAGFVAAVAGAVAYVTGAFASVGSAITDGLLGGLDIGAFVSSMAGMASAGLAAFKGILGIASPSKVMAKMGGHVAAGAEQGIDKGSGRVNDSAAALGEGIAGSAGGAAGGGRGKGGKTVTVNVQPGAIVIHAGGATIDNAALADAFERALASQGLGLAGA